MTIIGNVDEYGNGLDDAVLRPLGITQPHPLPDRLVLRDETGQAWTITVRPDGQLQTAKWPDGEPRTVQMWAMKALVESLGSTD